MKRMSDLKDNLRGVKCDATKKAFRYLKRQKRKPRVGETPTAYYIRVQIDGQRYDYYAASGTWAVTRRRGADGRWRKAKDAAEFYALAMERSAIRNSDDATDKQMAFIASLLEQTGAEPHEWATQSKQGANEEIERLLKIKAAQKFGCDKGERSDSCSDKPRLTASDQKVFLIIDRMIAKGVCYTVSRVAYCCDLGQERVSESIAHLMRCGLIPVSGNCDMTIVEERLH